MIFRPVIYVEYAFILSSLYLVLILNYRNKYVYGPWKFYIMYL